MMFRNSLPKINGAAAQRFADVQPVPLLLHFLQCSHGCTEPGSLSFLQSGARARAEPLAQNTRAKKLRVVW